MVSYIDKGAAKRARIMRAWGKPYSYIANKLGCSTHWARQLVINGQPKHKKNNN